MIASTLLKGLSEEKIVLFEPSKTFKVLFPVEGITRLVDKSGNTLGILLDKQTLSDIEEELEASNPDFLDSLKASRKSGRVSSDEVKRKAGLR